MASKILYVEMNIWEKLKQVPKRTIRKSIVRPPNPPACPKLEGFFLVTVQKMNVLLTTWADNFT